MKHARRSPSGYDRWSVCHASVKATMNAPRRSSIYAAEGTMQHEIAAWCLELGLEPSDFIGKELTVEGFIFTFSEKHADGMQPRLDWLREQPGRMYIEQEVDLGFWLPGDFGNLDNGWLFGDLLTIMDWKFGEGIPVSPIRHGQSMLYALGFINTFVKPEDRTKIKRVRLIIEQPHCLGGGGEWECTLDELLAFGEEARREGAKCDDPNAKFVASEKGCFWCALNPKNEGPGCETLERFNLALIDSKFEDLDEADALGAPPLMPSLSKMTPERRVFVWRHAKMLTSWLESVHVGLLDDAINGLPTPGLKAVSGRMGDRKYTDEKAAEGILVPVFGDDAFTKKVKSPAQVEPDLKPTKRKPGKPEAWAALSKIITQAEGKPALVPLDDERPALLTVEQKFEDVI